MANRRLLAYADALATSFPHVAGADGFDPARVTETGNPVRAEILAARGDYPALSADTPIDLLVVGGSQSARVFGEVVPPDRKSTRLNSSHSCASRMPSSA